MIRLGWARRPVGGGAAKLVQSGSTTLSIRRRRPAMNRRGTTRMIHMGLGIVSVVTFVAPHRVDDLTQDRRVDGGESGDDSW